MEIPVDLTGQTLGHYRIQAKLGEGGMGTVYQAEDTHLGRPVAIKVLSAHAISDPERKRRFVHEARTASSLNHPNIVHIYDIGQSGGIDFIAMEFVPGQTLDRLIGPRGMPRAEALNYAAQVASALARAHRAGIVHRDIKPANIMVTEEGLVKVLDFGLAKLTEPVHSIAASDSTETIPDNPRTEQGVMLGTIAYMSPEQAEGKKVDARSDIFSFGSLLYEMISGQRPFQGDSKIAILSAILNQEPKRLSELADSPAGPRLDAIVSRCLAKRPDARFQQMSEVKAALEGPGETGGTWNRRKWLVASAAAVLGLAMALGISPGLRDRLVTALGLGGQGGDQIVVVLPFQCAGSPDPAGQARCEGLGETLGRKLEALNQFQRGLRVLGSVENRGKEVTAPADARKTIGASLASTGIVQRAGGNVRVTATLVRTTTLAEMRRVEIEPPLRDASALEGMVRKIAGLLGLRWPRQAGEILAQGNTKVPEAYDAYLQAHGYLLHSDRGEAVDRAISLFQQALEKDPSYGLAHAGLCESYWAKNTLAKERQWADKAAESCLRAISAKADLPDVHVLLGQIYRGTGRPKEAVPEFERALQLDPLSPRAFLELGASYEALGRVNDAEATFQKRIELWPAYAPAYGHLGSFYAHQQRYNDAEQAYRKVVELAPGNSAGYKNLGAMYHYLGRPDDAIPMFKKSLDIQPTAGGYSNLATVYWYQGRYSDAVPLFEKATEMDPEGSLYWGNLGDAYRKVPELKARAPEAYRRAVKLIEAQLAVNPNDAGLRSQLAKYYAALGDQTRALAEISRARRLAPNSPGILHRAASIYLDLGRRDQAISALDLALQAGYSLAEVRQNPGFAELLKDPRFKRLEKTTPAATPGKSPQ
jgi:tetratricopeptide (TPR) repeat protein/predicted Ser/Thr protein kinase